MWHFLLVVLWNRASIFVKFQMCWYHVTFDLGLDLDHIMDAGPSGDYGVQVWSRSNHLSDLRKMFTDRRTDRRTMHDCISSRNELKWWTLCTVDGHAKKTSYSYTSCSLGAKFCFWTRNWPHIATHLVLVVVLFVVVWGRSLKRLRLRRFKSDRDENWQDCSSSKLRIHSVAWLVESWKGRGTGGGVHFRCTFSKVFKF